jgi:hypothetical protein
MAFGATIREMTTYAMFVWSTVDAWLDNDLEGRRAEVSNLGKKFIMSIWAGETAFGEFVGDVVIADLFVHIGAGKIIGSVSMGERFKLPYGETVSQLPREFGVLSKKICSLQ